MTVDLPSPRRPVRLARSKYFSSLFGTRLSILFSVVLSSFSLVGNIRSQHFPQCVLFVSPNCMPIPVRSSLHDLFGSMHHSCCPSHGFVPGLVFACHSAHPPRSILISFTLIHFLVHSRQVSINLSKCTHICIRLKWVHIHTSVKQSYLDGIRLNTHCCTTVATLTAGLFQP